MPGARPIVNAVGKVNSAETLIQNHIPMFPILICFCESLSIILNSRYVFVLLGPFLIKRKNLTLSTVKILLSRRSSGRLWLTPCRWWTFFRRRVTFGRVTPSGTSWLSAAHGKMISSVCIQWGLCSSIGGVDRPSSKAVTGARCSHSR